MDAITDFSNAEEGFVAWLASQIGTYRWIVARSSKKRLKAGYDQFFTQRRFKALQAAYEKETAPMQDSISAHLTSPNMDLENKRRKTPPGMAFWAGTGPQGKTCRECDRWKFDGYLASSGLLKAAPCAKYAGMTGGDDGPRVPHYASACKYFEQASKEISVSEPKKQRA